MRTCSKVVASALLLATLAVAASADDIKLVANGRTVRSHPAPLLRAGTVYVPLRVAAEAIGGTVDYDASTKRVTICRGEACAFLSQSDGITVGGRLLIGIRDAAEALGATVNWDAPSRTVSIKAAPPRL